MKDDGDGLAPSPEWLAARTRELEERLSALGESEQILRSVLDAVPDFIARITVDGRIVFANRPMPSFSPERGCAETVFDLVDPAYHTTVRECFEHVLHTSAQGRCEARGQGTFGSQSQYLVRVAPICDVAGVVGMTLIATDITGIRHAREAIEESEAKLSLAVNAAGMGLWSFDRLHDMVIWDEVTCATFGLGTDHAPTRADAYLACVHPDDRERVARSVERAFATGVYEDIEHRIVRPGDGTVRWLLCKGSTLRDGDGRVVKLVGGVLDVTEHRDVEERLRHVQKMDAVGQLTAGIAHNFNNMLTGIMPSVELALRDASPRARPFLENARDAAARAARMVRQLLLFAGASSEVARRPEDVTAVVRRTIEFFGATLERHIVLDLEADADIPLAFIDATQLEQALLNVLINARDAFQGTVGHSPRIRVRLYAVERGAPELDGHHAADAPRYVVVRVDDNGMGMHEGIRRRIFEPFFTTKEVGRGTGLGLAMVYGVIREHHGFVDCKSSWGHGTTLMMVLPAMDTVVALNPCESEEPLSADEAGATLLLVDDEEVVVAAVGAILGDAGYQVLTVRDGIEALSTFRERSHEIDLVLLDQSLPGLSGASVLEQLLRANPAVRVISFSGHAAHLQGVSAALDKPVNAKRLLQTVRDVLRG